MKVVKMNQIIIILAKIARAILHSLGRGTAFPGKLALKLNKNILNFLKCQKRQFLLQEQLVRQV